MKKSMLLCTLLVLGLLLVSGAASAGTLSLRGGYLAGNTSLAESSLHLNTPSNSYYVGGQAHAALLPVQFAGAYYQLQPATVPVSAMAGYKLNAGGSAGHILAGYGRGPLAGGLGWALQSFTVADETLGRAVTFSASGPAAGTFWNLPLADKLQLSGELHYAPSATVSASSAGASLEASNATILGYEARGAYNIMPGFSVEAGYRNSQLQGAEGYKITSGGVFAGAGVTF